MISVTRSFEWDAAHRLRGHEGQCRSLHGHRYRAEVTILGFETDSFGRVIDFGYIKGLIGEWLGLNWDHTVIVSDQDLELIKFCEEAAEKEGANAPYVLEAQPTAEEMAKHLCWMAQELVGQEYIVKKVVLYETPNCWATYERAT